MNRSQDKLNAIKVDPKPKHRHLTQTAFKKTINIGHALLTYVYDVHSLFLIEISHMHIVCFD